MDQVAFHIHHIGLLLPFRYHNAGRYPQYICLGENVYNHYNKKLRHFFCKYLYFYRESRKYLELLLHDFYEASVIASGFTGLGLGATPVGIADMNAITSKYMPSPKAFLVIPLVGAFFIDIVNALIIKYFAGLEIMSRTPLPG